MRKNTSRVEIIITISIENRIKSNTNFGHVLRAIIMQVLVVDFLKILRWGCYLSVLKSKIL